MLVRTFDLFGLAFQYQIFLKLFKKRMDKSNRKLKILYQCIKASAMWQHMLHIPPRKYTHLLTAPKKQNKTEPHKRAYLSEKRRFRGTNIRKMGQKQKRIRQKLD